MLFADTDRPVRKLGYDPTASVVDLLSPDAQEKLRVRVVPQDEFQSRIVIENLTDEPITVRLPQAVAAVHTIPKPDVDPSPRIRTANPPEAEEEQTQGNAQAVVGTFGPMNGQANGFPHQSAKASAFTIPAKGKVMIALHSVCAEHGKRSPIARMTYQLKALDKQVENETLREIIQAYDPAKTDSLAFQAVVWHLADGMSWEDLARKTINTAGGLHPYFTRDQLIEAQRLLEKAKAADE